MTLEERARDVLAELGVDDDLDGDSLATVAEALRTVRRETLEEAARVADAETSRYPDYDRSSHQAAALNSATQIAQAIRSLSEDKEATGFLSAS